MNPDESAYAAQLFGELFDEVRQIGLDANGATTRLAWTAQAAAAATWFDRTARRLGLEPEADRNGNRWAWTTPAPDTTTQAPDTTTTATGTTTTATGTTTTATATATATGAIVTGSHLDSVREGGSYDGALGVVAGLIAVHLLSRRGDVRAPLAVVSFADEEGGRFDTPTFGSRALLGSLDVQAILDRRDRDGISLGDALAQAGLEPAACGPDPQRLANIAALVELHIEQDTLLSERGSPLALGTEILPHGRWRLDLRGEAGHAGTTPLAMRRDPMAALAAAITAARTVASEEHSLATIGKLDVSPNATNAIAGRVSLWLDVRAEDERVVERTVARIEAATRLAAEAHGVELALSRESFVGAVRFSPQLRERVAAVLAQLGIEDVPMATGAGHDSGALAGAVPTAMLFARSANGASHSPRELVDAKDCEFAIGALTEVLAALASDTARTGEDG